MRLATCSRWLLQRITPLECRSPQVYKRNLACQCRGSEDRETRVLETTLRASDFPSTKQKLRLDAFLSGALPQISRSRLQDCIQEGQVFVNGKKQAKASQSVRAGDTVVCHIPPPRISSAAPEAIPLDIVYEDKSVIVINKAAGMVVHPSPGHDGGTLVNAILHHCGLPAITVPAQGAMAPASLQGVLEASQQGDADSESRSDALNDVDSFDEGDDLDVLYDVGGEHHRATEAQVTRAVDGQDIVLRPGIVHRLDKGTTGLMVVCKDDHALMQLGRQFRDRSVRRVYWSITVGVPPQDEGTVETNLWRHPTDRKKMATYGFGSNTGRQAISTYKVMKPLADGTAALVQWRLKTGRTHQIRVHAQYLGCPLFADEVYGGAGKAYTVIGRGRKDRDSLLRKLVQGFGRPALHAKTLGFKHPETGTALDFDSEVPKDFQGLLHDLGHLPSLAE